MSSDDLGKLPSYDDLTALARKAYEIRDRFFGFVNTSMKGEDLQSQFPALVQYWNVGSGAIMMKEGKWHPDLAKVPEDLALSAKAFSCMEEIGNSLMRASNYQPFLELDPNDSQMLALLAESSCNLQNSLDRMAGVLKEAERILEQKPDALPAFQAAIGGHQGDVALLQSVSEQISAAFCRE